MPVGAEEYKVASFISEPDMPDVLAPVFAAVVPLPAPTGFVGVELHAAKDNARIPKDATVKARMESNPTQY